MQEQEDEKSNIFQDKIKSLKTFKKASLQKEKRTEQQINNHEWMHDQQVQKSSKWKLIITTLIILTVIWCSWQYETVKNVKKKDYEHHYFERNPFDNSAIHHPNKIWKEDRRKGVRKDFISEGNQLQNAKRWMNQAKDSVSQTKQMAEEKSYYQTKYQISQYTQLPFCIVILTHNNQVGNRWNQSLQSVLQQDYSNFRLIVIDDSSDDKTAKLVWEQLKYQTKITTEKYKFIKNTKTQGFLSNIHKASLQFCKPEQILITIEGSDKLIGKQVLKLFNSIFAKTQSWFVYSNYLKSTEQFGQSHSYPQKILRVGAFRRFPFIVRHLRAFYNKLLLNVRQEDLKDQNNTYFKTAYDFVLCLPLLEQAREKVYYVPELTYYHVIYDNDHSKTEQQRQNQQKIRSKIPYQAVKQLFPKNT